MINKDLNFSDYLFWIRPICLVGIMLLTTSVMKAIEDCDPQIKVHSVAGNFVPQLGENIDKGIAIILKSIAESGLPGYCKMQVEVQFKEGLKFYPPKAKVNKKDNTHYYSLGYYTPTYTVQIKETNGTTLHQLDFGNEETYLRFPRKNYPKTQVLLEDLWASEKDSILQSLELKYSNELKGFVEFLERFRGEHLAYSNTGYQPIIERVLYKSEAIERGKKMETAIKENAGFLIDRVTSIPVTLKRGDRVTIISKGEFIKSNDRFSPNGLDNRLQRNYPKSFSAAPYGRLLANVGNKTFDIGKGGQFTVTYPDTLKLLLNAQDDNRRISGYFEAWIWVNDRLLIPEKSDKYISVLENPGNRFYPVGCSPDLSLLVGANQEGQLVVWRSSDGSILQTYEGHPEGIFCFGFLSEEPLLVTLGMDEQLKYWDIVSGTCVKTVELSETQIRNACFDPAMNSLVFLLEQSDDPFYPESNRDTDIYQLNLYQVLYSNAPPAPKVLKKHSHLVTSIGFLVYDDLFFSGDKKGNVFLWNKDLWTVQQQAVYQEEQIKNFVEAPSTYTLMLQTATYESVPAYVGGSSKIEKVHQRLMDIITGEQRKSSKSREEPKSFPSLVARSGDQILYVSNRLDYTVVLTAKRKVQLWYTKDYFE